MADNLPDRPTGGTMHEDLAELELELRLLPGVVDVGFGPVEPTGHVPISLVALEPEADLDRAATRVTRTFGGSATVEVLDLSPPEPAAPAPSPPRPGPLVGDERVALVESGVDQRNGEARVVLSWLGRSATGSAVAGSLIGPAKATLAALEGLGVVLDAALASVSSGQGLQNPPIRVILRSAHDDTEFVGIAQGCSEPESASRATLAAFNRYIGSQSPVSS